jgi:hypothetical protein
MAKVVNHVKMEDEDALDVLFWLQQSPTARIAEVTRLRVNYYTGLNGFYPAKIEKVATSRKVLIKKKK